MYDIAKIRADFPILARRQGKYPYSYLDSGATAQKPQVVIDKMRDLMENYNSNIHRGVHQLSGACTDMYEGAREIVRNFIGAGSTKEIIFTSGATASLNLVAHS
ncbi:MAG: aminotransferase class V-fold PLP-dependent enzyme, partial [Rikenellaceae bacterium]